MAGGLHRRRCRVCSTTRTAAAGWARRSCASAIGARTSDERRALLFPFLWGTVAKKGQIYGNQLKGSVAHVTNGKAFSYPGYNEMSTGYPNDAIDSNEFGPNPNATVFEWLNKTDEFRGRVAIYGTWNVYDNIFNKQRSGLVMQTGWTLPHKAHETPRDALLRELYRDHDAFRRRRCRQFPAADTAAGLCEEGARRGCCSWATARPTIGRIRDATTWCSTARTASIISSINCGTPCRPCPNIAARPPSSSPPIMDAAAD